MPANKPWPFEYKTDLERHEEIVAQTWDVLVAAVRDHLPSAAETLRRRVVLTAAKAILAKAYAQNNWSLSDEPDEHR